MTIAASMAIAGMDGITRARRHSRRVRLLRVLLPVVALATVVGLAVLPLARLASVPLAIANFKPVDLTDAAVTMESAKLAGFNRDNEPYEVTAQRARQSIQDPLSIHLGGLAARIGLDGGRWTRLEAAEGLYKTGEQHLDLDRGVQVNSSSGDNAILDRASIDLKKGRIVSDRPVTIRMGTATLAADNIDLSESGKSVVFQGRVVMVLQPKARVAAAKPETNP